MLRRASLHHDTCVSCRVHSPLFSWQVCEQRAILFYGAARVCHVRTMAVAIALRKCMLQR